MPPLFIIHTAMYFPRAARKDYYGRKQPLGRRPHSLSEINQVTDIYKPPRSILPSKLSLVAVYMKGRKGRRGDHKCIYRRARYGTANAIYVQPHPASPARPFCFIVLFWQLLAVNSQVYK